jgi:3-oxoacyl-[acyl-carrier-protein] synthase II
MKIGITGLGLLSAAGQNEFETLQCFKEEKRYAREVSLFTSEIKSPVFEVRNFSRHFFSERLRTLNLCLAATEDALKNANLWNDLRGKRIGVAMGTTVGSILNDLDFYRQYRAEGKASMAAVDRYLEGNLAEVLHSFLGTEGPTLTVVNACASGADAIGIAMSWIKAGLCDIALAGGSDEMNRIPLCGFSSLGILSDELCSPFDCDRKGLNLGEGAGVLVLENEKNMHARGASARAWLRGYGTSNDAHHLTSPDPEGKGLTRAIVNALEEAKLEASEISVINAHGTATKDNDEVEGNVISRLFANDMPFLSTKGYTGHTLGAAGALEAAFCILFLEQGWVPANAGFANQDDRIPIAPVKQRTNIESRFALSTSLGFGGCDAALILESSKQEALK